jgi:hypothetical protein
MYQSRAIDVYCEILNFDQDVGNALRLKENWLSFSTYKRDKKLMKLVSLMKKFTQEDFKGREEIYDRIIARIALAGT